MNFIYHRTFRIECTCKELLISCKPDIVTGSSTRPEVCIRHPIDQDDNNESLVAKQPGDSKIKLNFKSDDTEQYKMEFNLKELQKALKKCHDTAVGGDDIHYQFLKHLPLRSLDCLLSIFNHVWKTDILPESWKEAIVTPIPKPGKDSSNPANYRPIALTSCICKTMVNDLLVWFLEKNK